MSNFVLAAVKVACLDVLVASGKVLLSSSVEITALNVVNLSGCEARNSKQRDKSLGEMHYEILGKVTDGDNECFAAG